MRSFCSVQVCTVMQRLNQLYSVQLYFEIEFIRFSNFCAERMEVVAVVSRLFPMWIQVLPWT